MTRVSLSLTDRQHAELKAHLFPGDGFEAIALMLCGRRAGDERHRLIVRRIVGVPYEACAVRAPDRVTWSTDLLPPLLEEARQKDWAVVKIHGHGAFPRFSQWDDLADHDLFPSVHAWIGGVGPHGSAIMMADGQMFGRAFAPDGNVEPFSQVNVVGDDLAFWREPGELRDGAVPEFARRVAQSFGRGTYEHLRKLKIGVVGCSGTGSPVVEQLARNCVGHLVLVDPDVVEEKNLNRIFNTTMADAHVAAPKVSVQARAIAAMGLGTRVQTFQRTVSDREVVQALADCDVLFGCMDSVDGRHLLNKLATFYSIPYFDLGVKLEADGLGSVGQVCGTVHYLKPGGSSLLSRRVYTMEQVRAAGLARTDPESYRSLKEEGYIHGVAEDRPAVIQLNSLIASLAVNELLARLHPYRLDPNGEYAIHRISLSHGIYEHESDGEPCAGLAKHVGRADLEPLLDWPELSELRSAA
jgi:hypothetical protein